MRQYLTPNYEREFTMNRNNQDLLKAICKQERIETVQEFRDYFGAFLNHSPAGVAPTHLHEYSQCREFYSEKDVELWYCIGNHLDHLGSSQDALTFIRDFGNWDKRNWSTEIETAGQLACKVVWICLVLLARELTLTPLDDSIDTSDDFIEQFLSVPEAKEVTN